MILACGEALIDMLPRTSTEGETCFAPYPGGAVFNTAIALGRLGAPTRFFSGLSSDLFGDILRASLKASGVDASTAATSDRPTTLAFVTLVDGQASYAFYDENTAGRMLTESDLPTVEADALFFGGISLPVEPCGAAYEALMLREAPRKVTMIDPNIRAGFIRDEARYRARLDRMIAVADIVKVSDEDLHWLLGEGEADALAEGLLEKGPKLVCVTKGAEGATGHTAAGRVDVASERVEVVDTVGAGDTFNAGILASLQEAGALTKERVAALTEDEVRAALSLGARAAAVTVSRAGANPPRKDEL
ncbi:carbohydrate kinase family protein [Histidinibacterium aquaticum]|uniref:Carbohydrate kinase n=1 Tax=Histidinibacterium aquaticum TaxID=2613962 RepID=A0A5J5GSE7_9RHOB|nr:carbohydrate kinase [Histidinibacterium aquaticum]KAA9010272.1 carbohydrate kinase [Histidinibacterium aquaticum]